MSAASQIQENSQKRKLPIFTKELCDRRTLKLIIHYAAGKSNIQAVAQKVIFEVVAQQFSHNLFLKAHKGVR